MRRITAFIVFVFAIVCGISVFGQGAKAPFSLTISTPTESVKAGSEVRLDITLLNTSDKELPVSISRPEISYVIDVRQSGGNPPPETHYGRVLHGKADTSIATSVIADRLKPGRILQEHMILNDVYNLNQPGVYTVQASFRDSTTKGIVKSNKLTFTVTK